MLEAYSLLDIYVIYVFFIYLAMNLNELSFIFLLMHVKQLLFYINGYENH